MALASPSLLRHRCADGAWKQAAGGVRVGLLGRRGVLASLAIGVVCPAVAQDHAASAASWLRGLYGRYVSTGEPAAGIELTDAALERWFVADLAQAIRADRAAAGGEVPNLDGDPFVLAQDWDIREIQVQATQTGSERAAGVVRFESLGRAVELRVSLQRVGGAWRIADIASGGQTLSGIVADFWPLAFPARAD
jgi:hypothetical protein